MDLEKIVLVKKETDWEKLLRRYATASQAKFQLQSRGEDVSFYLSSHQDYHQSLEEVQKIVAGNGRWQVIDKEELPTFLFSQRDLVVALGDPGLFVNLAKYVGEQPVISLNPEPARYANTFVSCEKQTFPEILKLALKGKTQIEELTMAEARLEDGQTLYALNDLFIGRKTHVSARYTLSLSRENEINLEIKSEKIIERITERQSSSGIIISTGSGSTGWLTSALVGAYGIAEMEYKAESAAFPRNADYLQFVVREPFPSPLTGTSITKGSCTAKDPLYVTSNMPEDGVIFSDGIESDYLQFNAGSTATIKPAERKVKLVR
ncbi:NAD(+)/NADH kinase [Candidatus Woesearchaeota archaeon]|nr:NAD(+)/NADH kinase [Candidatus Woesearchaeota archaeon]